MTARAREFDRVRGVAHDASSHVRHAVLLTSFAALIVWAAYAARGWCFEWPLDYGEGPLLDQAKRIAAGGTIYPPTFGEYDGLVSNYPFVYPCLLALVGKCFGFTFPVARALTAASALACIAAVASIVRGLTRNPVAAAFAAALFAASPVVIFWSTLARVDFLALAFTLSALALVVRSPLARTTPVLAAVLLVLAVFTRQSHVVAGPLAVGVVLWTDSRARAFVFVAAFLGLSIAMVLALQALTHGGFWLHVVVGNDQAYRPSNVVSALGRFVLSSGPLLVSVGASWKMRAAVTESPHRLLAPFLVGALVASLTIGKVGSSVNHLLPLVAALAIGGGVALASAVKARWVLLAQVPWMLAFALLDSPESLEQRLVRRDEIADLARVVSESQAPLLADEEMGLLVLANQPIAVDPFDLTQLVRAGRATEEPLVAALRAKRFRLVLVSDLPPNNEATVNERWTPRMLAALHVGYEAHETFVRTTVYRPRS